MIKQQLGWGGGGGSEKKEHSDTTNIKDGCARQGFLR